MMPIALRIQDTNTFITLFPKTGTTSLKNWASKTGKIDFMEYIDFWGNPDKGLQHDSVIYCPWRPSYPRIISGLNTGLALTATKKVNESLTEEEQQNPAYLGRLARYYPEYRSLVDEWCSNPSFTNNSYVKDHTTPFGDIFRYYYPQPMWESCEFFHYAFLSHFHLYLNAAHGFDLPPIPMDGNSGRTIDDKNAWFPMPWYLEQKISQHPSARATILKRASRDFHPDEFLEIIVPDAY